MVGSEPDMDEEDDKKKPKKHGIKRKAESEEGDDKKRPAKRSKQKKPPKEPKLKTAHSIWASEARPAIKQRLQKDSKDANEDPKVTLARISKELSLEWKALSPDERASYEAQRHALFKVSPRACFVHFLFCVFQAECDAYRELHPNWQPAAPVPRKKSSKGKNKPAVVGGVFPANPPRWRGHHNEEVLQEEEEGDGVPKRYLS